MKAFVEKFPAVACTSDEFKVFARSLLPCYEWYRLNIYWTCGRCGITEKHTGKDVTSFSFNTTMANDWHKCAMSIYCAMVSVT